IPELSPWASPAYAPPRVLAPPPLSGPSAARSSLSSWFQPNAFFLGSRVTACLGRLLHGPQHAAPPQAFDQVGYIVRQTRKSIRRRSTSDGDSAPIHRPVNQQRTANNILGRNEAPIARVVAVVAIVAEDKKRAFGDNKLVAIHKPPRLQKPLR